MIEVNENDLASLLFGKLTEFLHRFINQRMRYFRCITMSHFLVAEKSAVDQRMVHILHPLQYVFLPFFPFIDIGDEQDLFMRSFDQIAHCFRIFIAMWNLQGSNGDLRSKCIRDLISKWKERDVIQSHQLAG